MPYGDDSLWRENDPLKPVKRRSWKLELIGAGLVILGIACGILGHRWGGSSRLSILIAVGVGIAIIGAGSCLISRGGGHGIAHSILVTVGVMMMLAGVVVFFAGSAAARGDNGSLHVWILGPPLFIAGAGLATGATMRLRNRSSQWSYYQMKAEDVERRIEVGEERSRIDQELRGR